MLVRRHRGTKNVLGHFLDTLWHCGVPKSVLQWKWRQLHTLSDNPCIWPMKMMTVRHFEHPQASKWRQLYISSIQNHQNDDSYTLWVSWKTQVCISSTQNFQKLWQLHTLNIENDDSYHPGFTWGCMSSLRRMVKNTEWLNIWKGSQMPRETVVNIKFVDQFWSKMLDQFLLYLDPCWSPLESDQIVFRFWSQSDHNCSYFCHHIN